ncbi:MULTISPECIES: DUF1127 domain-containing protein [Methylobacterium]|uniref:YjiS-like domain-containing protein n=1 Tax=Methylobacterium bullatum TaxID=570505 RepID=A0AAV4Z2T5_9HYPH|nr:MULTISPECIES: DUF1127 domain-containing protein [Methylobacterium]MBD8904626.1 hypothetical protein [Methylobacterium bullatum]TXN22234.1 DUF1127 domain-containing protein [Methylobacterium sp. WL19]GJD38197.1 hypothetical protein OICFNHDK_0641 [Methylobacterium bullatum]
MTTLLKQQAGTGAGDRAGRLARFARRLLAKAAAELSRQAINRRVLHKLSVMTDRELKDIGLIRQDVTDAGAGPADASQFLISRRDERREARRRPSR